MSDEIRAHLFDAFVTNKPTGTGLGLALVAKIIDDHGGAIEFDSEPGRTIFRVMLPLQSPIRGRTMSCGTTILIADDDRAIRTVLHQALGPAGPHRCAAPAPPRRCGSGSQEGEGQLVITDVVMPDENGLDLVPRIRKLRPDLRIIVMSAQSTLLTAVRATERGAFEYLPKPFDLNELISVVEPRAVGAGDADAARPRSRRRRASACR